MGVLGSTITNIFMLWVHNKTADMTPIHGAWKPPGGRRTTLMRGGLGMVSSFVAIVCSMVPSSSDPNPAWAFLKIVISTLVMLGAGLLLYWAAALRRARAM